MTIRLLCDLPINARHGATKGRVFEVIRRDGGLAFVAGDAGVEFGVFLTRPEILPSGWRRVAFAAECEVV